MDLFETPAKNDKFCACSFVSDLLEGGSVTPCDETNDAFNENLELPTYYDPDKFRRGQQFFHKHIWTMFFSKIMGLVALLSVPDLAYVLKFTGMSSEPKTAYKRYLATVFHMYIWYNEDFYPGSRLWKSVEKVRFKHNNASRRCCQLRKIFISQKNMALTQFGFMGFAVWKPTLMGIYGARKDELEAFIHVWRVIGHIMGIEERFNICRESVEETREICGQLVNRIFKSEILKKHQDFIDLSYALLTGMWCMMPLFEHKAFIQVMGDIVTSSSEKQADNNNERINNKPETVDFQLNTFEKLYARLIILFLSMFRFAVFRIFHQYVLYVSIWLMEHFPFLAYYMFGRANSHVKALD